MHNGSTLYGVAVATALLGKTDEKEIGRYLGEYEYDDIVVIRELQPILLDFSLTNEQLAVRISEVFKKYEVDDKI